MIIYKTDNPILFNNEMIEAIHNNRKFQTRRVIKSKSDSVKEIQEHPDKFFNPQICVDRDTEKGNWFLECERGRNYFKCPYGVVGGTLWVKQTWRVKSWHEGEPLTIEDRLGNSWEENCCEVWENDIDINKYDEWHFSISNKCCDDYEKAGIKPDDNGIYHLGWDDKKADNPCKWQPSIFMPKGCSNIKLEITNIRVERVRDITGEDAQKEGHPIEPERSKDINVHLDAAHDWFMDLWDSINKKKGFGWEINPWIFVVEFKKL